MKVLNPFHVRLANYGVVVSARASACFFVFMVQDSICICADLFVRVGSAALSTRLFYMSRKRPLWSDALEDEVLHTQPGVVRSMLVLFNCVLSSAQLEEARRGEGRSVIDALGLDVDSWPQMLQNAIFAAHRELAVI